MEINYVDIKNLKVSTYLAKFVNEELLKDLDITPEKFWSGFDECVHKLAPKNIELLKNAQISTCLTGMESSYQ